MGLEKVKKDILEKAKKRAQDILKDAEKEAEAIRQKARSDVMDSRRRSKQEVLKVCEIMEKKELSSAEFDSKKDYLDKKKEMIDLVFAEAMAELAALKGKERKDILQKLIDRAKKKVDIGRIYANKDDLKLISGFDTEERKIDGGIIVEDREGNVTIDLTFETLLADVQERNIQKMAQSLFS
ncbi:hypothetical protein JW968_06670 [Candidatus Woesearchaeota archaeon]|nr:hypothetical protein [Candidatus Woesearchaeota archaeon]